MTVDKRDVQETAEGAWGMLKAIGKATGAKTETDEQPPYNITVPYGLQLTHKFRVNGTLQCVEALRTTASDLYVVPQAAGTCNVFTVWSVNRLTDEVTLQQYPVRPLVTCLLYIRELLVFVGYCSDMSLCVFKLDPSSNHLKELSRTSCNYTIKCLAYNEETGDLMAGGANCFITWQLTSQNIREPLRRSTTVCVLLRQNEWVYDIQLYRRTKLLFVVCDLGLHVIDYTSGQEAFYVPMGRNVSLTRSVFHKRNDYFITGFTDGSIRVWNCVVFCTMHTFHGHRRAITGLEVYGPEHLLFSASKDGTLRIWRLDTFELTQRVDLGEEVLGLGLIGKKQLYYNTSNEVKVWDLNMSHRLFCPVNSTVRKMLRVKQKGFPARILFAAEDGGVRIVSPASGTLLTMIYPMADLQVFTELVYRRRQDAVYAVHMSGTVMVFSGSSNPCSVSHCLKPSHPDTRVLCITDVILVAPLSDGAMREDAVIFAGHVDGQLSLLESDVVVMTPARMQAHSGEIRMLSAAPCSNGRDALLVSCATDNMMRIWHVAVATDRRVSLSCKHQVAFERIPTHMLMLGTVVCTAVTTNKRDRLEMYAIERTGAVFGAGTRDVLRRLTHQEDDDHVGQVTSIAACELHQLFATTGSDGTLKLWSHGNQLVREMTFDRSLQGVCFCSDRGDIIVGFQNHISFVAASTYLPATYLHTLLTASIEEDEAEGPLSFDHSIPLRFDMAEVPSDTIGRVRHTKPAHDINATFPPLSSLTPEDVACLLGEEEGSGASPDLDLAGRAAVVAARRLTAAPQPPFAMATVADMTAGQGSEAEVTAAERMLGQDSGDAGEGGVDGKCGSLATLTTEPLVKPPLPIAIDGFIPNSTIRDLLGFKKPPAPPTLAATQWKPKQLRSVKKRKKVKKSERLPQEGADGEHVSSGASSSIESEGDPADVIMWASSSEDEIKEDDVDECAVSGPPTEDGKPIGFKIRKVNIRRVSYDPSWPTQPEDEGAIQPQQQESISGDAAEKLSSDLLLDEEAGDGLLDTDVDDGIPLLLKEIALESWFPKELELTVSWVVKAFLQIMDFVGVGPHKHLCNYIVRLHTELELMPSELDSLIDHLMAQLTHKQARIRCNAVRTLGQLGMARSDVLAGIMPMLVDAQVDVREEATSTFVCLTGVSSKSELINYFGKIGVMKPYVNTEEEVLSALANKLQHQRSPEAHDSALPSILWSSTEDAALPSATPDTFTPWILNDWVMKHFAPTSGQAASHQQMAQPAQRARQQRVRGGRNAVETGVGRSSARSGISRGVGRKSEFPTIPDSSVLRKPQLARQAPPSREKSNKVPHRPARVAQKKTRVGRQTPSGRKDLSNIDGGGILEEVTDDHYKGEPAERGGSGLMPLPQLPTRTHDWENDHTSTRDRTRLLPTNKRLYRMFESQLESSTTDKIRAAQALLKPAQQPGGTSEPTSTLHSLSDMLRDSGYASGFLGSQQWASSDAGKDSSVGRATAADAAPGAGQENVISGEMWRPRLKLPQLVESLVEGTTLKTFGLQDAAAQIGRDGGEGEGKERGEGQDGAMLSQKRRSQGEQSEKGGQSGVSGRSTNVDKHNSHKGRMQKIHGGRGQDTNEERGWEKRGGRGQDTNEERGWEKRGGRGQDTNEERGWEKRGGRGQDTNEERGRERRGGRGQDTNEERIWERRGGRGQDTNEERRWEKRGGRGQDTNEERGREKRGGRGQDTNEERGREKRGGRGQDTNEERRRERRGGRGQDTNEERGRERRGGRARLSRAGVSRGGTHGRRGRDRREGREGHHEGPPSCDTQESLPDYHVSWCDGSDNVTRGDDAGRHLDYSQQEPVPSQKEEVNTDDLRGGDSSFLSEASLSHVSEASLSHFSETSLSRVSEASLSQVSDTLSCSGLMLNLTDDNAAAVSRNRSIPPKHAHLPQPGRPAEDASSWRRFFDLPQVQRSIQRRLAARVAGATAMGSIQRRPRVVMDYLQRGNDDDEEEEDGKTVGDAGLRMLEKMYSCDESLRGSRDAACYVEALPGRLSVNTALSTHGLIDYGILTMQWATLVPQRCRYGNATSTGGQHDKTRSKEWQLHYGQPDGGSGTWKANRANVDAATLCHPAMHTQAAVRVVPCTAAGYPLPVPTSASLNLRGPCTSPVRCDLPPL